MGKENEIFPTNNRLRTIVKPAAAIIVGVASLISSGNKAEAATFIPGGNNLSMAQTNQILEGKSLFIELEEGRKVKIEGPQPPSQEIEEGLFIKEQKRMIRDEQKAKEADEEKKRRLEEELKKIEEAKAKISPPNSSSVSAQSINTGETLAFITGYYCEYDSGYRGDGGGFCGHMASGKDVYEGAAACGNDFEHGMTYEIEGYGKVVCEDTGHLAPNQIDIWTKYSSGLALIPRKAVVHQAKD